ncbi:hypothetical protein SteCoe_4357 [Stentor coeruleus]|uniref:EF-hand domain-containing protein n=1 Tax=Stentor coeruleus TaxID=5963 RepID=A0A1R2CV06_9CILI|nr:hypothetical protein SteCoe_4357 [Stentor coeruleus]
MGCCSEKMNAVKNKYNQLALSEEETVITMKEKCLPFSTTRLENLKSVILKNSTSGIMSIAQLRKAMTELDFDIEIFTTPEEHIQNLLRLLQNSKRLYDVKTVMLFGVLLCTGTNEEKAEILFDIYDINGTHCLQEAEINEMLSELIEISVNKIPRIAVDNSSEPEKFTMPEYRILEYTECLLNKKDNLIARLNNLIFAEGKIMRRENFIKRVSEDPFLGTILWSFHIRLALVD